MANTSTISMTQALGRRLLRTMFVLVLLAVLTFAISSDRLLRQRTEQIAIEQARFIASILIPGPNGDLSRSLKPLFSRSDYLVAVAILDSLGNPKIVYPDSPSHRTAVVAVLEAMEDNHPEPTHIGRSVLIQIPHPENEKSINVSGSIVNLYGTVGPTAQKMMLLTQHDSYYDIWRSAILWFTGIVGFIALAGRSIVKYWFDRKIARPLRDMATSVSNPFVPLTHLPVLQAGKWRETALIAHQYESLVQRAAHSDIERRKMELDAEYAIRDQEAGFDRKLRRVKDLAITDPLTGLKNRVFLDEKLEPIFKHQRSMKEDLSAIMIDIDNFKRHNDKNGHQAGDSLMQFIGSLLHGALRPTDHAVRYGGDEFLLLLPDTTEQQATIIADRIVKLFSQYAKRIDKKSKLSMSAGIASIQSDGCGSGDELVSKCDANMYVAKRMGKNRVSASCAT